MRGVGATFADPGARSRLRRRDGPRPDRRLAVGRVVRVGATAASVAGGLVLVGAATGRTFFFDDDQAYARPDLERTFRERLRDFRIDGPAARSAGVELPAWVDVVLYVLAGLVVAAFALALLYGLYRGLRALRAYVARLVAARRLPDDYDAGESSADDAQTPLRRRLREQFAAGGFEIGDAGEAREAVIACYQRMERTVAEAGTPRQAHETPEELLRRVLAAHQVPRSSVERLTELYEEARYSRHVVDDDMRHAARRCLDDVRAAVGG